VFLASSCENANAQYDACMKECNTQKEIKLKTGGPGTQSIMGMPSATEVSYKSCTTGCVVRYKKK
jgi:hypothetical protein